MSYDRLKKEASQQGMDIYEKPLTSGIKGLYADGIIWINRNLATDTEKACILAEEMGHYHTSEGNILDQTNVPNRKQEKRARNWAYERLVSLADIVQAYKSGASTRYEIAEHIGVTEQFLEDAIDRYKEKYGLYASFQQYTIYFDPLGVLEMFQDSQVKPT